MSKFFRCFSFFVLQLNFQKINFRCIKNSQLIQSLKINPLILTYKRLFSDESIVENYSMKLYIIQLFLFSHLLCMSLKGDFII